MPSPTPQTLHGDSLNIPETNQAKLKQLFPNVFTETIDENGQTISSLDFEKLKAELGTFSDIYDNRRERYTTDWPGKKDALKTIQATTKATLKPAREESINFDTTENLYIEGDNLEVLKLLQKSYYNKVKMIYIDPPYNTGKEFIYPDNFAQSLENYLSLTGQTNEAGQKLSSNTQNEGRYHTNWLNMMYPRLYLARNLLKEDGVIFVSIDDHEVTNLRKLMDEIFGEENFVANIIWQSRTSISDDHEVSDNHNYTLIYSKSRDDLKFYGLPLNEEEYSNQDNDIRGKWKLVPLDANKPGGDTKYPITNPKNGIVYYPAEGRSWAINSQEYNRLLNDGRIKFGMSDESSPKRKLFWEERIIKGDTKTPSSLLINAGTTKDGTDEVATLFGIKKIFDYPKPVKFIKQLLVFGIFFNSNDIILDFFSGSATTAHAVLELNKTDGGNRKFIMVQLPEKCDESSEAYKAGYKTIAEIGKERIRRVIKKLEVESTTPKASLSPLNRGTGEQLFDTPLSPGTGDELFDVPLSRGQSLQNSGGSLGQDHAADLSPQEIQQIKDIISKLAA
ncbi:MAG: site-specific DNA-methyltransferase [bacterium]